MSQRVVSNFAHGQKSIFANRETTHRFPIAVAGTDELKRGLGSAHVAFGCGVLRRVVLDTDLIQHRGAARVIYSPDRVRFGVVGSGPGRGDAAAFGDDFVLESAQSDESLGLASFFFLNFGRFG